MAAVEQSDLFCVCVYVCVHEAERLKWLTKTRRNGCPVSLNLAKLACPGVGMTG